MKKEFNSEDLVAYCGLYCGACRKYTRGKCPGCYLKENASWCKVKSCCTDNEYLSCADCEEFNDVNNCKRFNNFTSKVFSFIFRSNRKACIKLIKEKGYKEYVNYMDKENKMSIKK